jgi:acetyltransferase-like isoleucine patch superfamily enzyme
MYGQIRKKWEKNNIPFVCKLLCGPYYIWEKIFRGGWARYMIFQVGYIPSCHVRKFIYKCIGVQIGKRVVFHYKTEIREPHKLKLGSGCIIGDNAILDARNGLIMGQNVNLSSNVSIYTEQHDHRDPLFRCAQNNNKSVIIGNRAWIGSNVTVLPGVSIGEGAVCCAGCVVTKNVEPYSVVAGIPARKVNDRPKDLTYEFKGRSCRLY